MEYFGFTETLWFERKALKLIDDEGISEIQLYLCQFPERGSIIPDSSGHRETRRRAGYFAFSKGRILLIDIYAKNEKENLSSDELKEMKYIVQEC